MTTTIALLLRLLLVLGFFRVLGLPIARAAFPRLRVTAYALATSVGLVLSTHATWLLASAGMRIGSLSIGLGVLATTIAAVHALRRARAAVGEGGGRPCNVEQAAAPQPVLPTIREAAFVHVAFALAFTLALAVTARNPSVDPDSERFMDYAMVNAVVASRELPLEDPWLAGERVSYYDYGYYATAYLAILVGSTEHFFPVAVALLFAALFSGVTALGLDLAGSKGAVLAGFLVSLAGNLDALVQSVAHGYSSGLDWFASARVLAGCITEFPYFTLLWGDLHPYALALPLWPIVLATVATLLGAHREDTVPARREVEGGALASNPQGRAADDQARASDGDSGAPVAAASSVEPVEAATGVEPFAARASVAGPPRIAGHASRVDHVREAPPSATLLVGSFTYAALIATHTWDAVPAAALLALVAIKALIQTRAPGRGVPEPGPGPRRAVVVAVAVPLAVVALGAVLAIPFLLHVPTGGRGLAWVGKRSTLGELLTAWGGPLALLVPAALADALRNRAFRERTAPIFLFVAGYTIVSFAEPGVGLAIGLAGGALVLALVTKGAQALAWMMAATGLGLVFGVELLYVDDFYANELERMNTVFKAYVVAWLLLSLAAALVTPALLGAARRSSALRGALAALLVVAVVGAGALYPIRATRARAGDLLEPVGLDARIAFRKLYPDDAAAAEALCSLPRGRILETTGDAYSWNGRFATFSGYPAAVGWAHHEAGWRNDWGLPMDRARDVREAYSDADPGKARALVLRLGIDYVAVGTLERAQYPPASLEKFERLVPAVRAGSTVIYRAERLR